MQSLKQSGGFTISEKPLSAIRAEFSAGRSTVAETAETIKSVLADDGYLLDPHSAIGVKVARENVSGATPMVALATAHPAKFPDAVKAACGVEPQLPAWLSDLMQRKESFTVLHNDLKIVEEYVSRHSRAHA
jgi:threonine synthase